MLNWVTQERVKMKAEKGISFQDQIDSPLSPASKQLKWILPFSWWEIIKWPVVKLWESWYGLFAWPFSFRNFAYAWVLWKFAAGQSPKVPYPSMNQRSCWTLLTIPEHSGAPAPFNLLDPLCPTLTWRDTSELSQFAFSYYCINQLLL